jgi:hypothetical protein
MRWLPAAAKTGRAPSASWCAISQVAQRGTTLSCSADIRVLLTPPSAKHCARARWRLGITWQCWWLLTCDGGLPTCSVNHLICARASIAASPAITSPALHACRNPCLPRNNAVGPLKRVPGCGTQGGSSREGTERGSASGAPSVKFKCSPNRSKSPSRLMSATDSAAQVALARTVV